MLLCKRAASIETMTAEFKAVVSEKKEFENGDKSYLLLSFPEILDDQQLNIRMKTEFSYSNATLQVLCFYFRPSWKEPNE